MDKWKFFTSEQARSLEGYTKESISDAPYHTSFLYKPGMPRCCLRKTELNAKYFKCEDLNL
jgi:hypothetical protein